MKIVVVMGVAGAGKTTVGSLLAQKEGWLFFDADDFHSRSNVSKLSRGVPLTDTDRIPWVRRIRRKIDELLSRKQCGVIACSALKERYRKILSQGADAVQFVYLKGDAKLLQRRLQQRENHFMKVELLASQLEALEEPDDAFVVSADNPPAEIVQKIQNHLRRL